MGLYNANIMSRKSAYQYAVEGGYEGTEEEFAKLLGNIDNVLNDFYTSEQVDDLLNNKLNKNAIDDKEVSIDTTYSSDKINKLISDKSEINDDSSSSKTTYSSNKIEELISDSIDNIEFVEINDNNSSTNSVYSSNKVEELINDKSEIDDDNSSTSSTYSSEKIDGMINAISNIIGDMANILDIINGEVV